MTETFPSSSPEKAEDFSSRKAKVVAYLEQQIKSKRSAYERMADTRDILSRPVKSEPLGPIPEEVLRDGGSDLTEWRAQIGADREDDGWTREDDLEIEGLWQDLTTLEENLAYISGFQEYPKQKDIDDDGPRLFEYYLQKAEESENK